MADGFDVVAIRVQHKGGVVAGVVSPLARRAALPLPGLGQGRLRPPDASACPRDHLTSYDGRPLRYSRAMGRTRLTIRTDADTTTSPSASSTTSTSNTSAKATAKATASRREDEH